MMDAKTGGNVAVTVEPLALRPKQAAAALGIGVRLLWELTNRGEIKPVRIGRCVIYTMDSLRDYLVEQGKQSAKRT